MVDKEKIKAFLKTSKEKNEQAKQDSKDSWADITPRFSDNSANINDDLKEQPKQAGLPAKVLNKTGAVLSEVANGMKKVFSPEKVDNTKSSKKDKLAKEIKEANYLNIKDKK